MSNFIDDFKRSDQLIKSIDTQTSKESKALDTTLKSFTTKSNTISSQQNPEQNPEQQVDNFFKTSAPAPGSKQAPALQTLDNILPTLDAGDNSVFAPLNHDLIDQYQENQTKVNQAYHQSLQGISQSPNETLSFIKRNQLNGNTVDIVYICVLFVFCSLLLKKIS